MRTRGLAVPRGTLKSITDSTMAVSAASYEGRSAVIIHVTRYSPLGVGYVCLVHTLSPDEARALANRLNLAAAEADVYRKGEAQ